MTERDRRSTLGALLGLAAACVAAPHASAQEQKLAKKLVQYQDMPKQGQRCDLCVNWLAPSQCKIVAGEINPNGWCVAFGPKDA